jgi:hypothetical protein
MRFSTRSQKGRASHFWIALLMAFLFNLPAVNAFAHQPFFEDGDLTPATPLRVADPQVSTALYATLDRPGDVDYFVFDGRASVGVEVGMTIPQIDGQADFAPVIGLIGPGFPEADLELLPDDETRQLVKPGDGLLILPPSTATTFYEPFSRTSYWRRQRENVRLPGDGIYTLVVWSADNGVGRYVLVVGDREIPGGDLMFPMKLPVYWTPVVNDSGATDGSPAPIPQPAPCTWLERLLARLSWSENQGCAF